MKTETIKGLIGCFVFLSYLGFIIILFEIIYGTYKFIINDLFSVDLLYGFVLFYGYLFGGLILMVWVIKSRDLLERKVIEEKLRWKDVKRKT